jgi:hypothetical protein
MVPTFFLQVPLNLLAIKIDGYQIDPLMDLITYFDRQGIVWENKYNNEK